MAGPSSHGGIHDALFVHNFTYLLFHLLSPTNLAAYRLRLDQMIDPNALYWARREDSMLSHVHASKVLADVTVRAHCACIGSTHHPPFQPDVEVHPGFATAIQSGVANKSFVVPTPAPQTHACHRW
jgi:hypothetical protein